MISSFSMDVVGATLIEITWRSSAIVLGTWGLLSVWRNVSAAQRRLAWIVAHMGILVVTSACAASGIARARVGAPTTRTILFQGGEQAFSVVVPVRENRANVFGIGLVLLTGVGSGLALLRQTRRSRAMQQLVKCATPVSDSTQLAVQHACSTLGLRHVPQVFVSEAFCTAAVCGVMRPVLLLGTTHHEWNDERRQHVLMHELQHIVGRDLLTAKLSDAVVMLQWWNPVVYVAARMLSRAQEMACDARVVASGISNVSYAETLLDLTKHVQRMRLATELGVGGASVALRVSALLNEAQVTRRANSSMLLIGMLALSASAVLVPGFSGQTPPTTETLDMRATGNSDGAPRRVLIGRDDSGDIVVRPSANSAAPKRP